MALLYDADINPSKDELRATFLKTRSWAGGLGAVETVAAYRFDDPDGEVGLEGALLADEHGTIVHVPLTFRAAPLDGADEHLIGTTEHSVLGTRWVYDACGDPVWNAALLRAIAQGESGAEHYVATQGQPERVDPGITVQGSGLPGTPAPTDGSVLSCSDEGNTTVVRTPATTIVLVRVVGETLDAEDTLTATWDGRTAVLAGLTVSG